MAFKECEPATLEIMMEDNIFKDCTMDELRELWEEYKFFWTNGYTREGTMLDKARAYLCSKDALGVIIMEKALLTTIVCRKMEMEDQ